MNILSVKNLSKYYGTKKILEDITFGIDENEKIGIVGANGAGKTTLFKLLTNEIERDSGEIFWSKNIEYGYLKQNLPIYSESSIYEEALEVFKDIIFLENELRELENLISKNYNSIYFEKLLNEYDKKSEYFKKINGFSYRSEVTGVLYGLGFKKDDFCKKVKNLSGGEQTRLNLSKLLLRKPNVLLLDEPTNHLDTSSVEWLENHLKQYKGNALIISHDRYFLDRTVDSILELRNKKSYYFNGNYTYYINKKEELLSVEEKQYKNNQQEIKRQKEVIDQLKSFGREKQVKRARSREKLLEKIEIVEKPISINNSSKIKFIPSIKSGFNVLKTNNLIKKYSNKKIFSGLSFEIFREDKVALIGKNGIGKTTLFNILLNKDKDFEGNIIFGTNVNSKYFDQTRDDLNKNNTIIDEVWNDYPHFTQTEIRNYLAAFLFKGDDVFNKISSLSGGEKARISLLKIMLSNSNFLFLDEPTNHLDIESKNVLEKALLSYEGTLFFISHDRYFINSIATKIFEISEDGIRIFLGNYDDYQYSIQSEKEKKEKNIIDNTLPVNKTKIKESHKKEKEKNSEIKKIKNNIKKLEEEILELELELKKIDELLCLEEIYSSPSKMSEIMLNKKELNEALDVKTSLWENLIEQIEY